MFELPIALASRRIRNARKLRYQYVNNLSRKYGNLQGNDDTGLPTPESSATEASENEEANQRKRKRIRRRWKSIVGESYSDSDTDVDELNIYHDESGQEVDPDDEDQERRFFKRHEKPQKSFEKWQTDSKKRVPIQKHKISYATVNRIQKYAKRKVENSLAFASKSNRIYFDTISQGYELIDPLVDKYDNFQIKHITTLTTILHLNVSRKNWDLAYKCFALLIRIPTVEIRTIWGVGERILAEREPMKSLEFLEWMISVYSSRISFVEDVNHRMPPVFTKGSKTHVPKYALTWMWKSLTQCTKSLDQVRDESTLDDNDPLLELIERISEMVLGPPYMEDSEVWFIYALCHMIKADILSRQFNPHLMGSSRDIASNQVIQHIQNAKSSLQTCSAKGDFRYPRRYIERQLKAFELRLQKDDESHGKIDEDLSHGDNLDTQSFDSEGSLGDSMSDITSSD